MWELDSAFRALLRLFVQIAQFFEKHIVCLPELESVQPITRLRRELDRREVLDTFCHGDLLDRLILCAYIVLCIVNPMRPAVPVPPRITERIWIEVAGGGQFTRFPWILDRVRSIRESRPATSAAGPTRGSPRVGAAAD